MKQMMIQADFAVTTLYEIKILHAIKNLTLVNNYNSSISDYVKEIRF
jgi:hypothetical protein